MVLKLTYFGVPGLGEASRIILDYGKVAFEDVTVTGETFPPMKASLPFGQVPILTLDDGRVIAQSGAIERYTAHLAGLYPKDPVAIAYAEQAAFLLLDVRTAIGPSWGLKGEEQIKKREEMTAGVLNDKLLLIVKLLESGPFLGGAEVSFADIQAFVMLGCFKSGDWTGFPTTLMDTYPTIKAYYQRIASLPAIKARYANATGSRAAYKAE